MKFIRKHSKGPWKLEEGVDEYYVLSDDIPVMDIDDYEDNEISQSNRSLIAVAPEMLDYLIEKVELLKSWKEKGQLREGEKEDFYRIIEIIKKTGVEVVE